MIHVEVQPAYLVLDQPSDLSIILTNTDPGTCTGVLFTVQLPVELVLLQGKRQCRIQRLEGGSTYVHRIQVRARQGGTFVLYSASFSYRNPRGVVVQAPQVRIPLQVEAFHDATAEPQLRLSWEAPQLVVNKWGGLQGRLCNDGPVSVTVSAISAYGPLKAVPARVGTVSAGESIPFTLRVYPSEAGSMVPVVLEVVYEYGVMQRGRLTRAVDITVAEPLPQPEPACVRKVLFLFSCPKNVDRLRLGEEERVVRECFERARLRDAISWSSRHATRIDDMRRAIIDEKPDIVHFSGHGAGGSLILEDEDGQRFDVHPDALGAYLTNRGLECVIFNACFSSSLTHAIAGVTTISMHGPISDKAAIEFTRGFYDIIGAGGTPREAFDEGVLNAKLKRLDYDFVPVFLEAR